MFITFEHTSRGLQSGRSYAPSPSTLKLPSRHALLAWAAGRAPATKARLCGRQALLYAKRMPNLQADLGFKEGLPLNPEP